MAHLTSVPVAYEIVSDQAEATELFEKSGMNISAAASVFKTVSVY